MRPAIPGRPRRAPGAPSGETKVSSHGVPLAAPDVAAITRTETCALPSRPDGQELLGRARRPEPVVEDDQPADLGCEWWSGADGDITVVTDHDTIVMVNRRDVAHIGGHDLIGMDPIRVSHMFGEPDEIDEIAGSWTYASLPWRLEVGFAEGHVSWVALSNEELFQEN